jgi:uncharacterized membrane protein YkvA (DUF1232 family)
LPPTHHGLLHSLRDKASALKRDTLALYLAARDPRTPWYARLVAAIIVAYVFSPFDLIPDFIPVVGLLDDLIIVPLGIAVVVRLVPGEVLADCRAQARSGVRRHVSWGAAVFMIAVWIVAATWLILVVRNLLA